MAFLPPIMEAKETIGSMAYEYQTRFVGYNFTKKAFKERLDKEIGEMAKDGWRLIHFEMSEWHQACLLAFERAR